MQAKEQQSMGNEVSGMSPLERRASISLAAIMATRMLGLFMILPVFALYAESLPDSSPLLIGLAIGIYGLTQALLQIPFGMASDKFGRRSMITIGLLLFALGSVAAASADSLMEIIFGRALQGAGAVAAVIMALTADLTREEQRTKAMAVIGMSIGGAFTLALVIGPLLNSVIGVSGIFWFTAILALLAIVILWTQVPQPVQSHMHHDAQLDPGLTWSVLKDTQLLRLDAGIFILHTILTSTFIVVPFVLRDSLGIEVGHHSWVYLPVLLLSAGAMVPFIIVAEKKRKMKQIFVSAVTILGLSLLTMSQWYENAIVFFVLLWLFFTAFNFLEASLPSLVSKTAHAARKGTAMGVYSSSQFLGAFVGGSGGGLLYGEFGISGVFISSALLIVVWWVLAITMRPPLYLANIVMPAHGLDEAQASELAAKLETVAGVVEVVVIIEENEAYLKVDNQLLDRDTLQELLPS